MLASVLSSVSRLDDECRQFVLKIGPIEGRKSGNLEKMLYLCNALQDKPGSHNQTQKRPHSVMLQGLYKMLLPLDGCGGLGGDIVADAVDATDLVDDLV